MSGASPAIRFKFGVGRIVLHRRYGYRGVIFQRDPQCRADDDWRQGNQTQPKREQPWYHVLVHEQPHITYVAESNLEPDPGGGRVVHPLLHKYFKTYFEHRYYNQHFN